MKRVSEETDVIVEHSIGSNDAGIHSNSSIERTVDYRTVFPNSLVIESEYLNKTEHKNRYFA